MGYSEEYCLVSLFYFILKPSSKIEYFKYQILNFGEQTIPYLFTSKNGKDIAVSNLVYYFKESIKLNDFHMVCKYTFIFIVCIKMNIIENSISIKVAQILGNSIRKLETAI